MEILLTSVQKFSLSESNMNFLSKRVKCITLVTLTNSVEVRTVSVLHVKAPVKSCLGCIQINPWINPENSVYQIIVVELIAVNLRYVNCLELFSAWEIILNNVLMHKVFSVNKFC